MALRDIRYLGDPVLSSPADAVVRFDRNLEALVKDLLDTVKPDGRAGLAAPQIGVGMRVFSYDVGDQFGYVINPEVVELSEEVQDGDEGCLSVPGLRYPTRRANEAVVRGVDLRNEPVTVRGTGLMARCLQHETDHLDGKLYLSRLEPEKRRSALKAARESEWFWAS
ncbi:peptide deformylase [Lentzea tibetensis]|uniref:Peptide deformylase n=1 Tax=Lentzea tibetensis TaxID=2591470 RepID=A0A563EFN4_9PSEU|nr:peptide deformylase [Lentzea tibetensis]TWP44486.1 peptide deformylase [Lentzea tibetensis]